MLHTGSQVVDLIAHGGRHGDELPLAVIGLPQWCPEATTLLREAGLIDCSRRGPWVYYWAVPAALDPIRAFSMS